MARKTIRIPIVLLAAAIVCWGTVLADGTENLGPPWIIIDSGTGMAVAGTGMISQPGTITVDVPVGADIKQVLLYWEGFMSDFVVGDDTVKINNGGPDVEITGTLIGGPTAFFPGGNASTYRADITSEGLVSDGMTTLSVSDMSYTGANNGAGVLVIFDDGSSDALIEIRDGSDVAFINFSEPLKSTVAQQFAFPSSTADRTAMIAMFFSSVAGSASGSGVHRPSSIEVTVYGAGPPATTVFSNLLDSHDGDEWDTFVLAVTVPAGADMIEVQAFSRDDLGTGDLPASFDWNAAGFALEPEEPPGVPGRITGGGSVFRVDGARVTRGFELHCDLREPNNLQVNWPGGNKFHLTDLTGAVCTDDPMIDQHPPSSAPFDTFEGFGTGKYGGEPGATVHFIFVDAGEPGVNDTALIQVWDAGGTLVLEVSGYLDRGNVQTHKDNQSTL